MLAIENLDAYHGKLKALSGVSLTVNEGEIVAIIGANGAGKTTLLNTIVGLHQAAGGIVRFLGKAITNEPPEKRAKQGMRYVMEGRGIFRNMKVRENLELGALATEISRNIEARLSRIYDLFPPLKQYSERTAATLSGGEQQMLALGRAIMGKPRLLIIDELSQGLAPLITRKLIETLRIVNEKETISILLVEQSIQTALRLASRAYLLELGKIVLSGTSSKLLGNEYVKDSYLGGSANQVA